MSTLLTPDCNTFVDVLTAELPLSLRVVQAWALAETGGGHAGVRGFNFLNIGNTDTAPLSGPRWATPTLAAEATVQWLRDNPRSGQPIIASVGQSDAAQLAAIAASPFSSSHYGPAGRPGEWLQADYARLAPEAAPVTIAPDFPATPFVSLTTFLHPALGTCAAAVTPEGAVYCHPGDAYLGGANGQAYFAGRTAAHIEPLLPSGYRLEDTEGEWYSYPGPSV